MASERAVRIPTGLNLGIPWQWGGDVRAMRAILGDPGYYDWHWVTGGENYQRMIYSRIDERDWRTIQQLIRRDPSHLWLVMNEPERRDQANLTPADGADLAKLMRLAGACIAAPGVIITTQGLDWLDDYLSAGGPVPEAWHVHLYFAETAAGMDRRLETWGDWMVKRGIVRPTIISEFNAQGADVAGQMAMMSHMAKRLDEAAAARDRGLDAWLWAAYWFSLKYKANENDLGYTDLIDDDLGLTKVGRMFVELQAERNHDR